MSTRLGWSQAIADLTVYLETGVAPERFFRPWVDPGAQFRERQGALATLYVALGGLADCAGLRAGDLLICLGGRPIYTRPELQAILRGFAPGDSVEMDWIRDGARMEGSATLSESAVAGSRATSA